MVIYLLCDGVKDLGIQKQSIHVEDDMGCLLAAHVCSDSVTVCCYCCCLTVWIAGCASQPATNTTDQKIQMLFVGSVHACEALSTCVGNAQQLDRRSGLYTVTYSLAHVLFAEAYAWCNTTVHCSADAGCHWHSRDQEKQHRDSSSCSSSSSSESLPQQKLLPTLSMMTVSAPENS
jgi:hypothetical protein